MPQIPVNSANIIDFGFSATFDLYAKRLLFDTGSLTTYETGGAANVLGICFQVIDSLGIVVHEIDFTAPDIIPASASTYSLDLSGYGLPFVLGNTFKIIGQIKDQDGTIYATTAVFKKVCKPAKLNESGYVPGIFQVTPDCVNNVLTVKELTPFFLNGKEPTSKTKTGVLNYPTGSLSPVNFTNTPFSNNQIITGENSVSCTTEAIYDLGDDIYEKVTYLTRQKFPVTCQDFLGDIYCCLAQLQRTYQENCDNAIGLKAKQQTYDILLPLVNGIIGQFSGKDVSAQVAFIKKQLGCDCGTSSLGQNEMSPVNPAVNSIVLIGAGGTTIPDAVQNGDTRTYTIASNSYIVGKGDTGDLAYNIAVDTSTPNVVRYKLTFNYTVMAGYILTAIAASPSLITQLNNLITASAVNLTGLDGKCIIDLSQVDYVLSQSGLSGATTLTSILINGIVYDAPPSLFATDTVGITSWLNGLGKGTFVVIYSLGVLTITSTANTNTVASLTIATPNLTIVFQSTSATLVQLFQATFDYICALNSDQIALAGNLTLYYIDYNGSVAQIDYTTADSQQDFNTGLANVIAALVARMNTLTAINCSVISALFPDNGGSSFSGIGRIFGKDSNGSCVGFTAEQIAIAVFNAANTSAPAKAALCAINCSSPATCPDISGVSLNMAGPNIGFYGLTWATPTTSAQTVTIKYRLTGTVPYTIATNALAILANGNINGTTPYQISGVTPGATYDVSVQNNCGGVGFVTQITVPTSSIYSGSFLLDTDLYNICGGSPVTLYSSAPFAASVFMFADVGLTVPVTGYDYISGSTGNIFTIDNATGQVLIDTGQNCNSGTPATYKLGNNAGTICSGSSTTLYTDGNFAVGKILYSDSSLSTPVTGYAFVSYDGDNHIYNLNSGTGEVVSDTLASCSVNYELDAALNYSIDSVTGLGIPALGPTGLNNSLFGNQNGMSGVYSVHLLGSNVTTTKLVALVAGVQVDCVPVSGAGFYNLTIAATSAQYVKITVNGGTC